MFLIQQVNANTLQNFNIALPDATTVLLQVYWRPMQYGWWINNLTYGSFILNGIRIVNSPNMLLQYQNQIPFGLACYSTGNREPSQQQDFSSGNSKLYILDSDEVQAYYKFLQTGVVPE